MVVVFGGIGMNAHSIGSSRHRAWSPGNYGLGTSVQHKRCLRVAAVDTLVKKPKLSYVGIGLATSEYQPRSQNRTQQRWSIWSLLLGVWHDTHIVFDHVDRGAVRGVASSITSALATAAGPHSPVHTHAARQTHADLARNAQI